MGVAKSARSRVQQAREASEKAVARVEAERGRHASVAWMFEVHALDGDTGGALLAGAFAYRIFIWLLPFALVLVAGLGVVADAESESPGQLAGSTGLSGLVTSSVSQAAKSNARWYALLIGIPVLVWATRGLLRALTNIHRLIWTSSVRRRSPKLGETLRFLGALLAFPLTAAVAAAARHHASGTGLIVTLLTFFAYTGLYLLVSTWLPHGEAPWQALLPGSFVFALGLLAMHVLTAYFIVPLASSRQDSYGSLGGAAALLLALYIFGRLLVFAAVVNATLWERGRST